MKPKVKILPNIVEVMTDLGFDAVTVSEFSDMVGKIMPEHNRWKDGDQEYVTVDLCTEVPAQCCERVAA